MAKAIPIDRLASELESIMSEYEQGVNAKTNAAVKAAGQAGAKAIRANVRQTFKTHSEKPYAKRWRVKNEKIGAGISVATIYSTKAGLPHVLEFGHAKRGGGRTEGRAHIKPVEEMITASFEKEVERSL